MNNYRKRNEYDRVLLFLLLVLMVFGVLMIYSASTTKIGESIEHNNFYIRQIIFVIISLISLFILLKLPYMLIEIMIIPLFVLILLTLVVVLFLPAIKGSHRWISLGILGFQPSELAKLLTIMLVAKLLDEQHLSHIQMLLRTAAAAVLPVLLIFIEPDLGTAMTLVMSILVVLAFSDLPFYYLVILVSPLLSIVFSVNAYVFSLWILLLGLYFFRQKVHLLIAGLVGILNASLYFLTPFVWNSLKSYQQNRILTFINPLHDPFGSGYQIIQAKIAIGSGGWFGKGFLLGSQKNLQFLPEHHTDFIFSVIGEELGFFGCLIFISIYILFLYRIVLNVGKLKRRFMFYTSVGIIANLSIMMFVNIGMNMGLVPATGIPLPFIAYGGTSLLFNTLALGVILKFASERSVFE
ncbi:MAG: rod shape-determining protein RodA [Candidatus Cloacimonetes bacterium]|nr:rod shape-determining protein RodA [Candidatus Cloacimonadota bacterium]